MDKTIREYQCHKRVHATPMTRGEFVAYKYPNSAVNLALDMAEDGYLVIYSDTYESWSPKTTFDEGYTEV
jgi:hypothetical protein